MSLTTRTAAAKTEDAVRPLWPATVIDPFAGTGEVARNAARLALRVPERAGAGDGIRPEGSVVLGNPPANHSAPGTSPAD